jgi:Retrotransposon gag protein
MGPSQTLPPTPTPTGTSGNAPAIFDGDQTKSEEFMGEFKQYWLLNPTHPNLSVPTQRVVWCLTFMRGPKVADWVQQKTNELEAALSGGTNPNHEKVWTDFKKAFESAFADTGRSQSAFNQLVSLTMKGGDLDDYITKFNTLRA